MSDDLAQDENPYASPECSCPPGLDLHGRFEPVRAGADWLVPARPWRDWGELAYYGMLSCQRTEGGRGDSFQFSVWKPRFLVLDAEWGGQWPSLLGRKGRRANGAGGLVNRGPILPNSGSAAGVRAVGWGRCGGQSVWPLQGEGGLMPSVPRAMPWADMWLPLRGGRAAGRYELPLGW